MFRDESRTQRGTHRSLMNAAAGGHSRIHSRAARLRYDSANRETTGRRKETTTWQHRPRSAPNAKGPHPDRRGGVPARAGRSRHRLFLRQSGHRLSRRSSRPIPGPQQSNAKVPQPLVIPHECIAVAMAHGAYLMNGRPQAVMLHVNVGTANAISNVINLYRDHVPLILAAGGSPITEQGRSAAATATSTGRRRCSTRPACCARR